MDRPALCVLGPVQQVHEAPALKALPLEAARVSPLCGIWVKQV